MVLVFCVLWILICHICVGLILGGLDGDVGCWTGDVGCWNPESGIRNSESGIRNRESGIRDGGISTVNYKRQLFDRRIFLLEYLQNHKWIP